MVSVKEAKQLLYHIADKFQETARRIKGAKSSTFEFHSYTTGDRTDGSLVYSAYAVLISEDGELVKEFIENYRAWMKIKDIDRQQIP